VDSYDRDHETEAEKLDRNWNELLQELRVSQTGVQLLTGFLLTLPVQPAFKDLSSFERWSYVAAIGLSIVSTCLLITPVAMHRHLFRQRRKETLVEVGHRVARLGLVALALAIVGVVCLVFALVFGDAVGMAMGVAALVMFTCAWVVLPIALRGRLTTPE
jgi:hypothetical protein